MTADDKIMGMNNDNGSMEDLAAVIGYTAATDLLDWFSGTVVCVPVTTSADHVLARVIGDSPFARLVKEYGGKKLSIPLDHRREISRRNRMIGAMILKGVRPEDIARIALMTKRQVYYVRSSLEQAGMLPYILGPDAYSRYLELIQADPELAKVPAA